MLKKFSLRHEIVFLLSIKLLLLLLIWWCFFSEPIDKKITPKDIQTHFYPTPVPTSENLS